jgi:4-amino-4-deoxy-L-arabinose transferase-like glycosyltransferase
MRAAISRDRFTIALLLLVTLAAGALRVWQLGVMPLFADEAYYLLWSQRLAPGYYDHPAAVALLLRLSVILGGDGETGVRWLNALVSTACVPLIFAVGKRYVSPVAGWLAALSVALGPVYVLTGRVVYPDALQFLLLLLNLLALAPLIESDGTTRQWVWFGLTLGALLNTKGTSLLYLAGLGSYALLWRRDWLGNRRAWLGSGVALALLAPWLAWSARHDWPSLRLALHQGGGFGLAQTSLSSAVAHAWRYLTLPSLLLAALAALGAALETAQVIRHRKAREPGGRPLAWMLLVIAAVSILAPMLLSAANSPRNLALGLLPLWPLAGLFYARAEGRGKVWLDAGFVALFAGMAVCAGGTVMALSGPARLPQSSGAAGIRQDSAGWPEFGAWLTAPADDLLFAVDYSIAGQVAHYTGRPVQSSLGQFRYWGVPDADDWTVLAQGYVPAELITERLRSDFETVTGPEVWVYRGDGGEKSVRVWRARGRRAPTTQLLDDLDFLALAQEAQRRAP